VLLEENDRVMIESPHAADWFIWGMHCADSPQSPGEPLMVVELSAVKEMIGLVAQGYATGQELHDALDALAWRLWAARNPAGGVQEQTIGDGCPHECPVCVGAWPEFDAIATESLTYKMRLSDSDRHPYAAGKNTLHRSVCPKVARYVGRAEPLGASWSLAGLPAFAHHGVYSTAWASGMQVMTVEEAAEWVRQQVGPEGSAGYRLCGQCLPDVPDTGTHWASVFGAGYWQAENAVTWE
jgi:hypothetical protein